MSSFVDHFSEDAAQYADFRPTYPEALYEAIRTHAPGRALVWDCATGSGQAAGALARDFDSVIATDASAAQLSLARRATNIRYVCCLAERPALARTIADCVTVAQAAHWLSHSAFYAAVHEVARPGALVVLWSYGVSRVTPAVDAAADELYAGILDGYWSPERRYVDEAYRTLPFPFDEIEWPRVSMAVEWSLDQFAGYISTWSAVRTFRRRHGDATLAAWSKRLTAAWGVEPTRSVKWPIAVRAGYVKQSFTRSI